MKLSVIVPVYNMVADGKLNFCMDSLVGQTIDDYEIIAVDDASTDDSYKVLLEYAKKYPKKVKVIKSPENRRQGGAKNLGMRAATGEWLGFIDSDDWVSSDYYEKLLKKAEETGADIVSCKYCLKSEHDFETGEVPVCHSGEFTGVMDSDKHAAALLHPGSMVVKIYKRSIFYDNGLWFPEHMFFEDNCLGPLTMLYCKHFEFVDEPNYYYYQVPQSTTHHVSLAKCNDRLDTMTYFVDECYKRDFLPEYPEEIEYKFTEIFYVNTLFSYMREMPFFKRRISFLRDLRDGIMAYYPDFENNSYFIENTDDEVKKLTAMHCRSPFKFFWYYSLLCAYRKIRYGHK